MKNTAIKRHKFERWYGPVIVLFLGFVIADLLIISFRDLMLPSQAPQTRIKAPPPSPVLGRDAFQIIVRRNVLSSADTIPPELVGEGQDPNQQKEETPILSQLPLGLVGTLVHSNPEKSLAAIELRNKSNQVLSYPPKREIDGIATVEKVERTKVIIRNINTGRLEYLEMKNSSKLSFGSAPKEPTAPAAANDVKMTAPNKYEISRQDLNKYTNDLSGILMQARAVPARRPGSGEIYGWRLLEIQPNSIYTRLGLQVMDVITGVNGSPVTSAQQAMEMYGALKSSNNIKIQVERGGKAETFDYNVKQ